MFTFASEKPANSCISVDFGRDIILKTLKLRRMAAGNAHRYTQNQLSVDQQVSLLKSRGLLFIDEGSARHVLNRVSMFRMRNYFRPMQIGGTRMFKPGSTFEQAVSLYEFDSELRKIICTELEKIEISVRTQLSYAVTDFTNDPFWFTRQSNFRVKDFAQNVTDKIRGELDRNDDDEILDFRKRYNDPFPPSWVIMEVSSFGTLSKLYKNLSYVHCRRNVANYYGLSGSVMESWLYTMVYVRNVCAHFGRLWDRKIHIRCIVPKYTSLPFLSNMAFINRMYFVMSIILYFLQTIDPQNDFARKVKSLLGKYQNVDIHAMGFPTGWENELLWQ